MRFFHNLSVKTKLLMLGGIFIGGFLAFAAFSYRTLYLVQIHGPYYQQVVQGKDLIADILPPPAYILEAYLVVLQMVDETESAKLQQLIEKSKTLRAEYEGRHEFWKKNLPDGKLKETLLVKSSRPAMEFFDRRDREFIPWTLQGERDKAKALAQHELKQLYEVHRAVIDELVPLVTDNNTEDEQRATDAVTSGTWGLIALGLGVLILGALASWRIGRSIIHSLGQTVHVLQAVAAGDFTQRLVVRANDEIGQLARALNQAVTSIGNAMVTIAHNANTLASASEELAAASQQLSKNVQTVAAGTEEMSASIKEIAKSVSEAARVAGQAVQVADATNATIAKLGESSMEIGNVIKVITSIAEQTNLLALNATIEAARAGEAGKGFAVVANEVKELAKQTSEATEDIGRKIGAIQQDTQGAVAAIGQISAIIAQINDISNTIASAVEEQSVTTNEMARNVAEVAKGSSEIAQNVSGMAQAVQSTASGATETRAAAHELSRMATELQRLVGQFRYEETKAGATEARHMPVGLRLSDEARQTEALF
jgi:methyl-accepting chemotaxis protein